MVVHPSSSTTSSISSSSSSNPSSSSSSSNLSGEIIFGRTGRTLQILLSNSPASASANRPTNCAPKRRCGRLPADRFRRFSTSSSSSSSSTSSSTVNQRVVNSKQASRSVPM